MDLFTMWHRHDRDYNEAQIHKKEKTTHFSVVPNGKTLLKKEKKGKKWR